MKKLSLVSAMIAPALIAGCSLTYSQGFRVGQIQKATYKGFICKSYEGELVLEGIKSKIAPQTQSQSFTNVWAFSATDDAVIKQLESAVNAGSSVKLEYTEVRFKNPFCSFDTNYIVTKVTPIGGK